MYLDQDKKKEIFGTYGKSNTDTGSPEAQIALFSYRIAHLAPTSTVTVQSLPRRNLASASNHLFALRVLSGKPLQEKKSWRGFRLKQGR